MKPIKWPIHKFNVLLYLQYNEFFIIHIPCLSLSLVPRSVSMIDMRGEDESMLQPHSQVRHELMHNQYNKLKEEEDHWQDVSVSPLSHFTSIFVFLFIS